MNTEGLRATSRSQDHARRVLLVEEDVEVRSAVAHVLRDEGYEVASCRDGREALEHLRTAPVPDLVILDLTLPGGDGRELRARLRADPSLPPIPLIVTSHDPGARARAVPADTFLAKPFGPAELLGAVEGALGARQLGVGQARLEHTQRLASIGMLAAGTLHEIRNPLGFVIANLRLAGETLPRMQAELAALQSAPPGQAPAASCARLAAWLRDLEDLVRDASAGAGRIDEIARDLRVLARSPENRRERVAVAEMVDAAIQIAACTLRTRARLVRDYLDVPPVWGDPTRLVQVFLNLLINAAQALPDEPSARHEIRVVIRPAPGKVVVEVADTGIGLDPAVRARLFEPFFTTKAAGAGTGLGLSICRNIVMAHGGGIEAESEPGRGSVFRVTLPSAHRDAA